MAIELSTFKMLIMRFFSLNSLGTVRVSKGQRLYVKTNLAIPVVILPRFRPAVSILLVPKPLYTRMGI